jgi:hypothetical protein
MTKRYSYTRKTYVSIPRIAFKIDDDVLAKSPHKLRPVDRHLIVTSESDDVGLIISRVARLLKPGFNVFVKSDSNYWLNHFDYVGEGRYDFKVYTRKKVE